MMRSRRDANAPSPGLPVSGDHSLDTAWRIHGALVDWTGKVDSKASFCLAVESALIAIVVNLTAPGRQLSNVGAGAQIWLFRLGLGALTLAVLSAVAVVIPRLRRWQVRKGGNEWRTNHVYFGHLRHWDPSNLEKKLQEVGDPLPALSRHLVNMSRIAWTKHSLVQMSLFLAVLGTSFLVWCGILVS
jgi:hypothetical protein